MVFDNIDRRIKYYHLALERELPERFEEKTLPEGYRIVSFPPEELEEARESWMSIEISAKELADRTEAREAWDRYYGAHEQELPGRMFFVEHNGKKVATATAIYDTLGKDDGVMGWLHWVAVAREEQGKGLSKPLIAHALNRLIEQGYQKAHIPTQCTTWVAVKIYLDFGFMPEETNAVDAREGWNIARTLTGHPALKDFDILPEEQILR